MSQADAAKTDRMADPKLFPDGEMKAMLGEQEDQNTASTSISRAKRRIENAGEQARRLRQDAPEFWELLEEAICEPATDERLRELERKAERIEELEQRVAELEANSGEESNPDP